MCVCVLCEYYLPPYTYVCMYCMGVLCLSVSRYVCVVCECMRCVCINECVHGVCAFVVYV